VRPSIAAEGGARRLRRSSVAELAIGVVVLAVTAVLVATPTPMDGMN
jgi:putative copper export protein